MQTIPIQYNNDTNSAGFNVMITCTVCRRRKKPFQMTQRVETVTDEETGKTRQVIRDNEVYCGNCNEPFFSTLDARGKYLAAHAALQARFSPVQVTPL